MPGFSDALGKIEQALQDLSSLEVVSYKGSIDISGVDLALGTEVVQKVLAQAKAKASLKLMACTYFELDSDTTVFYDEGITADERAAHQALVDAAVTKRDAVLALFREAIAKRLS